MTGIVKGITKGPFIIHIRWGRRMVFYWLL